MLKVELPNRKEVAVSNYYWNLKKQKNDINQKIKATQEEIKKCKEMLKRQLEDGIDVKYKKKLDALLKEQAVNFQRLNEFNENVITDTPSKKQLMRAENRKRNLYSEEEKPNNFQHYTSYVNPIQIRFDNKLKNNIAKLTKNFEASKEKIVKQYAKMITDEEEKPTLFEEFRKRTSIELEERITVLEQELKQEIYTVTKELEQEKEEAIRQAIFNKVEHCKQILEVFYKQVFEVLSKRQKLYEELLSITYKKLHFSINNNEVPTNIIESEKIVNEECLKLTNEIKFVSNKITRYENIILYSSKIYNDQNIVDVYEQMTNNRNTIKENLIIEIKERFKDRVWKKISGTTNYEVSDHGEIISYSTNYPILKTPYVYEKRKSDTQLGSLAVGLMKYNDKTNLYVRQCLLLKRIVAQEFLPNEFQEFCRITHKDGNPLNCSVTNLIIKKPES